MPPKCDTGAVEGLALLERIGGAAAAEIQVAIQRLDDIKRTRVSKGSSGCENSVVAGDKRRRELVLEARMGSAPATPVRLTSLRDIADSRYEGRR